VTFPDLRELKAYPFDRAQNVPNVPQIYLMYAPGERAGRVGSCHGNNQFKRHAMPAVPTPGGRKGPSYGWLEDMHLSTPDREVGSADSMRRIGGSNFCLDAHRLGARGFVYYVLEQGQHLADTQVRRCREQRYMDALRDQTDLEDYTGQAACSCGSHPAPRRYVRARQRNRD